MCRKQALAATALLALTVSTPALALPWGGRAKPADAPQAAAKPPTPARAAAPAPVRATAQERAAAERLDPLARAAFWAGQLSDFPDDAEAGVKLAGALRLIGRYAEATQAAQRVLVVQPANLEALLEVARSYIAQSQGFYAIDPARQAQAAAPNDWRAPSLLGVALEMAERDDEALVAHRQALALAPTHPTTLSNLAMYYAGHGDVAQAESLLRLAVASPQATILVRQNLALVLGLQGKLPEAERLVRQDLPPEVVANNVAYLRAANGEAPARNWNSLREPARQN